MSAHPVRQVLGSLVQDLLQGLSIAARLGEVFRKLPTLLQFLLSSTHHACQAQSSPAEHQPRDRARTLETNGSSDVK